MTPKKKSKRSKKAKDKAKEPAQPHAKAFTFFFKEKDTAISMLKGYLPANIKKKLDFKSLKISKDSFIDKRLKNYFADLLYEIKLKSGKKSAFIYILFEHKCWEDWFVCLQLLKYMVRIWELFLKQNKDAKYLPVIEIRNKLWDIFKLFLELSDKNNISEYLEVLVTYLVNSPGKLTEEELQKPVNRLIEEGGADMQTIFEKWVEKGVDKGIKQGMEVKAKDTAKRMLEDDLPIETISRYTGLTEKEIKALMN